MKPPSRPAGAVPVAEIAAVLALTMGLSLLQTLVLLLATSAGAPWPVARLTDRALLWSAAEEIALGGLALFYLHRRGWPIGALWPRPSAIETALGFLLLAATLAAMFVFDAVFGALGVGDLNEEIARASSMTLVPILVLSVVNGAFEELIWLGYLLPTLSPLGPGFAIGLSAGLRSLVHFYQGPAGATELLLVGLAWGALYWRLRALWPFVLAHIVYDVIALSGWLD